MPYLWYSDLFASELGSNNLIFTKQGSAQQVQASTGVTRRPVEFIGDIDGDGKRDLAVGGPNANGGRGEFTILY